MVLGGAWGYTPQTLKLAPPIAPPQWNGVPYIKRLGYIDK